MKNSRTEERKAYEKKWAAANPERRRAYRAKWAAKNPQYWKAKYHANAEAHSLRMKKWYEANRASVIKRTRANKVLKIYGLTPAAHAAFLAAHDHRCGICFSGKKLVIDHDHRTGRVRGLLCDDCNVGLGRFRDDFGLVASAISYLRAHARNTEAA